MQSARRCLSGDSVKAQQMDAIAGDDRGFSIMFGGRQMLGPVEAVPQGEAVIKYWLTQLGSGEPGFMRLWSILSEGPDAGRTRRGKPIYAAREVPFKACSGGCGCSS
jgi:hypothetical protein